MMWRVGLVLISLSGCGAHQATTPVGMTIPYIKHNCRPAAPDPKPLAPLRTLEQFKEWAMATARARDIDRANLFECELKLNETVDLLNEVRDQMMANTAGAR